MSTTPPALKRLAVATLLAVAVVAVVGAGRLELNSHYTAYFDDSDPLLIEHEDISTRYGRQDSVFVVLQSADGFLNGANYRLLEDVSSRLSDLPAVSQTLSITDLGILGEVTADNGDLIPSLEQLENESLALGLLLAEDTLVAGIQAQIELPDSGSRAVLDVLATVRETVESAIGDLPVSAHYTGTLALNEAYIDVVRHDLKRIVPLLLLVMLVVLHWLLRSTRAVLTVLPVGLSAVFASFGVVGLFGAELAAIHAFVPIIVLSISLAGCVHMALSYGRYRSGGKAAVEAAIAAARYNLLPMALANGTTALGFLGLALSPSPPIRVLGYMVAAGIAVAFVLCMTLLPLLQGRFDPWKPGAESRTPEMRRLVRLVNDRRRAIVAFFAVLSIPAAWFASQNAVSDNVLEYFAPSHSFHRDTQLVEDRLSGVNELLYSIESGAELGLFDAESVEAIGRFSAWLGEQPEVTRVVSIADTALLREARDEGRLSERLEFLRGRIDTLSGSSPLVSQTVSDDYSSSLVTAYLAPLDSTRLIEFDRRAREWAAENLQDHALQRGGPALMFAVLGEQNIRSMLTALTVALLGAALLLGAIFRSARVAWAGLICNFLPVLFAFSVWAVLNGHISIGAAVVIGMVLGILLDDTVYLLATYHRALRRRLVDPIGEALHRVGPALIVTTVTLVAGLSLGMLSDFGQIWSMSALSISIIATALVVDLLLLPALLPTPGPNGDRT